MRRIVLSIILAAACTLPARGDELRAAAQAYMSNPAQQRMIDQMFAPEAMAAQMKNMVPNASEDMLARAGEIIAEELGNLRPALEKAMLEAAIETFTLAEIQALDAFYSTSEGAAVMQKMQPYMLKSNTMIAPEMRAMQGRIVTRIQALVKK